MDSVTVMLLAFVFGLPLACASATSQTGWETHRFGDLLEFSAPADLRPSGGQGIDTRTATWQNDDLELLIDYGMYADPLGGHAGKPGFEAREEPISGVPALIVSYDAADGRRVVAAHFPDLGSRGGAQEKLTLSIHARGTEAEEAARRIIRSVEFTS